MNNSSPPGDITDAVPSNDDGVPNEADEEDNGYGTSRPPLGVFQVLGIIELERRCIVQQTIDPFLAEAPAHQEQHDDDSSVETDGDDAIYEVADDDAAGGGIFDSWNTGNIDFFPAFSSMGNPRNHETRAINHEGQDVSLTTFGFDVVHPNKRNKKYSVVFALLIFSVGIFAAVLITAGKSEDALTSPEATRSSATDDDLDGDGAAVDSPTHQGPMEIANYKKPSTHDVYKPTKKPSMSSTTSYTSKPSKQHTHKPTESPKYKNKPESNSKAVDLSMYGYTYILHSRGGWLTWPPEVNDQTSISSFDVGDGITSFEECAAKCQEVTAFTGAWDAKDKTCWCSFVDVSHLCREPCVIDEYLDFSTVPISSFGYCKKSVCDKDGYHTEDYCEGAQFDKDACDAKIATIEAFVASSSTPDILSESYLISNKPHILKPSAMTTIKKSTPGSKTGGLLHVSVEGDERISFVRFELPSVLADEEVIKATLNLYLISHHKEPTKVSIEALPHGGRWPNGSVSWNDQIESRETFHVNSFESEGLESGVKKELIEVDVSSAINSKSKRITFKLSTESSGRMDFAGKEWNGGESVPELILILSA